MTTQPLYMDWHFWSALAAWLALGISTWKPIKAYFRGPQLRVEPLAVAFISEFYGLPRLGVTMVITNIGGMAVRVRAVRAEIRKDEDPPFTLPGEWYFKDAGDNNGILFSPFRLNAEDHWTGAINFYRPATRAEERNLRNWQHAVLADIAAKRQNLPNDAPPVNAEDAFWQPLAEFYNMKFKWAPGEYRMRMSLEAEPMKASVALDFRFTVFEADTDELRKTNDDIRKGFFVELRDKRKRQMVPVTLSRDAQ